MTTHWYSFSGVQDATTFPSLSEILISPLVVPPKVTSTEGCVESLPKFCAIPCAPEAKIIPPLIAAFPL